ncbi:hypothetical protein [Methylovorus glucosotrophus]|uniref:Uncharacterized protein n=1 Tax=Methylovorus glucosotrophus (strain SIP3-4) TaxID=582744 RepID=C6X7X6_METGS|nr:hypothetical protein [Methylovorus glucosotrophus]ACT51303.1 hypothetical protein Msip34_2061 [Methylovorus glucosotrophus SIP3-4]
MNFKDIYPTGHKTDIVKTFFNNFELHLKANDKYNASRFSVYKTAFQNRHSIDKNLFTYCENIYQLYMKNVDKKFE